MLVHQQHQNLADLAVRLNKQTCLQFIEEQDPKCFILVAKCSVVLSLVLLHETPLLPTSDYLYNVQLNN